MSQQDTISTVSVVGATVGAGPIAVLLPANPQRTGIYLANESTGAIRIYADAALVAVEVAAEAAALATYNAAVALLDSGDGGYAAAVAALATTRNTAYSTARTALLYVYKQAAASRELLPLPGYHGPLWVAFEVADGRVLASEVR